MSACWLALGIMGLGLLVLVGVRYLLARRGRS